MKFECPQKQKGDENLIPLINIVFLILIFFLIATVIRPFSSKDIDLARSSEKDSSSQLTHRMTIDKTGQLYFKGAPINSDEIGRVFEGGEKENATLNIIVDKALPASKLLEIVSKFRNPKMGHIKLVLEKIKK